MGYTLREDFEDIEGNPGDRAPVTITQWAGLPYSERRVFIEDQITFSGNRSLNHWYRRQNWSGEYTNAESTFYPSNYTNPNEGDEGWARMMVYVPSTTDWRAGGSGTSSGAEPKFFRVYWRTDRWIDQYFQISRGGGREPSWYRNTYPHGVCLGARLERYHRSGYGTSAPWTGGTDITYRAPIDSTYSLYTLPYDRWVSVEVYIYFSSDASRGKTRFWLDETLIYEQTTNTWDSEGRNSPSSRPQIQTFSTWGSGPYTEGKVYTDDYMMTTDSSLATKTDSHGNRMLGRADGNGNGGNGGNGNNGDTTPPVITDISEKVGETSATITWDTDEDSNSVVDYGATENRGTLVYGNDNTTKHVVELTNLDVDTQYYYRLSSKDASGNVTLIEENRTFTTGSQPEPGEVALNDLTDVSLSSPVRGQILIYDGTHWVNKGIDLDSMIENKVAEVLERAKIVVT